MGRAYQQIPVAITVEGANILTRSLIIFGQGAIRCHPYVLKEMQATREPDRARASRDFDRAFWGHIGFTLRNAFRAFVMGLTGSHWVGVPANVAPENRRYYQQLTRFSSAFAFVADVSMLVMGGSLKRKEKLSARLGDILSMMYLVSAALKRYEDEGRQQADKPLLDWAVWDAMFRAQNAFEGVLSNYPSRMVAALLRLAIFPLGRPYVVPSDRLGQKVAKLLIEPSATRDRLTAGMFLGSAERDDTLGVIDAAMEAAIQAESIEARIRTAQKAKAIAGRTPSELVQAAVAANVITAAERDQLTRAAALRDKVVRVDDFPQDWRVRREDTPAAAPRARVAA
jgi:acyl-CoA dehydrogenase